NPPPVPGTLAAAYPPQLVMTTRAKHPSAATNTAPPGCAHSVQAPSPPDAAVQNHPRKSAPVRQMDYRVRTAGKAFAPEEETPPIPSAARCTPAPAPPDRSIADPAGGSTCDRPLPADQPPANSARLPRGKLPGTRDRRPGRAVSSAAAPTPGQ